MKNLNVRHLEIFRTVVRTGSVSAAARALYVSQPAVTKTLHLLEAELGLTLFQRVKGRLICTPEAEVLLPEVERMFGALETVGQTVEEIRQGARGQITIATVSTIAMSIVAKAISQFHRQHPEVRFTVHALPTRHVVEYVNNSQADFGILDVPAPSGTLQVEEFCRGEICCVMRQDHALARHAALTPELLKQQKLISFGEDTMTAWRLREAFRSYNQPFEPRLASNSTLTICAMVSELDAIALIDPFTLTTGAFSGLVSRKFTPRLEVVPRFLFSPNRPQSLGVRAFTETLRKCAQRLNLDPI